MISLGATTVSRDGPPFVLAEIGVNHDGSVERARQLIEAAREAGAHGVKFQLFDARMLLAAEAGLVDYQKAAAGSAHDLLEPLQLTANQLTALVAHAHDHQLAAIITPFSPGLVAAAAETGCDAIKLASPDLVNRPLVEEVIGTGLPMIVSSGAATMDEIARTADWLGDVVERTVLLHCVSSYPTPEDAATLGAIQVLRHAWPEMAVGYSDHTTSEMTGALAVAAGACFLEKHLTHDRAAAGPDHAASLEPGQFAEYVKLAAKGYAMRGAYVKQVQPMEREVRLQTRQSVVLTRALPAGTVLNPAHLTVKRPGTGIPAEGLRDMVGRTLVAALPADHLLQLSDLGDPEPEDFGKLHG